MSTTPIKKYRIPILRIIVQLGGRATTDMIKERLPIEMKQILQPEDMESIEKEDFLYWNRARNAREIMKKEGLLHPVIDHGVWKITEAGRAHLSEHDQKIEKMRSARNRFDMLRSHVLTETKAIAEPLEGISFDYSDLNRNIGNIDYFLEQVSCDIDFEIEKLET